MDNARMAAAAISTESAPVQSRQGSFVEKTSAADAFVDEEHQRTTQKATVSEDHQTTAQVSLIELDDEEATIEGESALIVEAVRQRYDENAQSSQPDSEQSLWRDVPEAPSSQHQRRQSPKKTFSFSDPSIVEFCRVLESSASKGLGDELLLHMIRRAFAPFASPATDRQFAAPSGTTAHAQRWKKLQAKHRVTLQHTDLIGCELSVGQSTADGNCLFSSVGLLLYDLIDRELELWLRARCVFELVEHLDSYREELGGASLHQLLTTLLGGCGTRDPELDVLWLLANVLERRVVILREPHTNDNAPVRVFVPHRSVQPSTRADLPLLVVMHIRYSAKADEANHYQPLRVAGTSATTSTWSAALPLHRPATVALFDRLKPFWAERWCGPPPVSSDFCHNANCLDERLLGALAREDDMTRLLESLLPTAEPSIECVRGLVKQFDLSSCRVAQDIFVIDANEVANANGVRSIHQKQTVDHFLNTRGRTDESFGTCAAVLMRLAGGGDRTTPRPWVIALLHECAEAIEVWSNVSLNAAERRRTRGATRSTGGALLDVTTLPAIIGTALQFDTLRSWHCQVSQWSALPAVVRAPIERVLPVGAIGVPSDRELPLWALSQLWRILFCARDESLGNAGLRVNGATRRGCALALVAEGVRFAVDRAPPLSGAVADGAQRTKFAWIEK